MWWVAVLVPVVVLAVAIAVVPLAFESVRFHRWHTRRMPRRPLDAGSSPGSVPGGQRRRRRVRCTLCLAQIEAGSPNAEMAARNEHILRAHVTTGTPSLEIEQGTASSS